MVRKNREISTLTLGISRDGFNQIKERIRSFRKEVIEIARNDENEDRVYQCNLDLFPLTRVE